MKKFTLMLGCSILLLIAASGTSLGAVTVYLNEAAYLADMAALGYSAGVEGFEDDRQWGTVRSSILSGYKTAPSIVSKSITWTANNIHSDITTFQKLIGGWQFSAYPHGDFDSGTNCDLPGNCGDGFTGVSSRTLYGFGGWISTSTPPAKISISINGAQIGFGQTCDGQGNCVTNTMLETPHPVFFGIIDDAGFATFTVSEVEGTAADQKLIFADDFTFGVVCPADSDLDADVDGVDLADLASSGQSFYTPAEVAGYFGASCF